MISASRPPIRGYRDLADYLRAQIRDGTLPPGHAVPSERQLTEQYGVNRTTAIRALTLLRHEGLIVVRRGYGATVREEYELTEVHVDAGARVHARMPSPAERDEIEQRDGRPVHDGVPVLIVVDSDGWQEMYAADRTALVTSSE